MQRQAYFICHHWGFGEFLHVKLFLAYTKDGRELCFGPVHLRSFVLSMARFMSNWAEKDLNWLGFGSFHTSYKAAFNANIKLVIGIHITENISLQIFNWTVFSCFCASPWYFFRYSKKSIRYSEITEKSGVREGLRDVGCSSLLKD